MKCLIVDDEFANRSLLETILSPYGQCTTAVDGKDAVERFQEQLAAGKPFDLVCLDIAMPRMDGLEALRTMRGLEKEWDVPWAGRAVIMMITSREEPNEVLEAFQNGGCHGYVNKPVTPAILLERVAEYLSLRPDGEGLRDNKPRRSLEDLFIARGYTIMPGDDIDGRVGKMVTRFIKRWPRRNVCTTPVQEVSSNHICEFSQAIDSAILKHLASGMKGTVNRCVGVDGAYENVDLDLILSGIYSKISGGIELTLTLRDSDGLFVDSVRGLLVKRDG